MATTYLTRTQTAGNRKTWTLSVWFKRSELSVSHIMPWCAGTYESTNLMQIYFPDTDILNVQGYDSGGSLTFSVAPNRVFRDTSGWYHLVVACDTTQGVAADRLKIYINGVEETSLSASSYPAEDLETAVNENSVPLVIGNRNTASYYFGGLMSHLYVIDGLAYAPTVFGSTDSDTGEWVINTSPSVTYGTNGVLIMKDGNTITDQGDNSNDFTLGGGTLTATEDCPDDVFSTLNPLQAPYPAQPNEFANGNTSYQGNYADWQRLYGTIGAYKGKFYYECKITAIASYNNRVGWDSIDHINPGADNYYSGLTIDGEGKLRGGILDYSGYDPDAVQMTAAYSGGNLSFTASDILGMALDRDNNTFSLYKNGSLEVDAYSFASASNCSILLSKGFAVGPSVNFQSTSGDTQTAQFNFGNGYFGTTAISSAGTNASGIGLFEYDVPAGYTAFSTKGLQE